MLRRERLRGQDDAVTETHAGYVVNGWGLLSPARVPAVERRALGIGGRRRPLGLDQRQGAQDRDLAEPGQPLLALQVCVGAHVLPSAVPRFLTRLGASPGSIRRGNDRCTNICAP